MPNRRPWSRKCLYVSYFTRVETLWSVCNSPHRESRSLALAASQSPLLIIDSTSIDHQRAGAVHWSFTYSIALFSDAGVLIYRVLPCLVHQCCRAPPSFNARLAHAFRHVMTRSGVSFGAASTM